MRGRRQAELRDLNFQIEGFDPSKKSLLKRSLSLEREREIERQCWSNGQESRIVEIKLSV